MILETERLILRPWQESDAEDLYRYASDPVVGPAAGWPAHTSVEDSLQVIRDVLAVDETYAVCLRSDGRAIGSIGLMPPRQARCVTAPGQLEVGYWIGAPFWGRGYIPEAVRRVQRHAFEDQGCTGLWCGYYEGNRKSLRVQQKCGFTFHHTEENVERPLFGDVKREHYTFLSRERWLLQ